MSTYAAQSKPVNLTAPPEKRRGRFWALCLLALAVLVLVASNLEPVQTYVGRVNKERELITASDKMLEVIDSYYRQSPGTAKQYPTSLRDLRTDPRFLADKQHLEYLEIGLMTFKPEWGVVKAPDGGIIGVHSLSEDAPTLLDNCSRRADRAGRSIRIGSLCTSHRIYARTTAFNNNKKETRK